MSDSISVFVSCIRCKRGGRNRRKRLPLSLTRTRCRPSPRSVTVYAKDLYASTHSAAHDGQSLCVPLIRCVICRVRLKRALHPCPSMTSARQQACACSPPFLVLHRKTCSVSPHVHLRQPFRCSAPGTHTDDVIIKLSFIKELKAEIASLKLQVAERSVIDSRSQAPARPRRSGCRGGKGGRSDPRPGAQRAPRPPAQRSAA